MFRKNNFTFINRSYFRNTPRWPALLSPAVPLYYSYRFQMTCAEEERHAAKLRRSIERQERKKQSQLEKQQRQKDLLEEEQRLEKLNESRRHLELAPQRELEQISRISQEKLENECALQALTRPNENTLTDDEKNFLEKMYQGNVLAKVIFGKNFTPVSSWAQVPLCQMLKDYSYRPELRGPYTFDMDTPYYKYVHMTSEVVHCRPLREKRNRKQDKIYAHTKKCSTTLVSDRLLTPLISSGVALGFDLNQSILKAMFTKDSGTYQRRWVSEIPGGVFSYANNLENGSSGIQPYRSLVDFKNKIRHDAFYHNEVLAKVNRLGTLGFIVYEKETHRNYAVFPGCYHPGHIKSVNAGQKELQKIFSKKLPILFYNNSDRACRIFTEEEQELAKLKNLLLANQSKSKSLQKKTLSIRINGLFDGKINHYDAVPIINLIQKLEDTLNNRNTKDLYSKDANTVGLRFDHYLAKIYIDRTKALIAKHLPRQANKVQKIGRQ